MTLERLRNAFYRDDATRGVLAILADQSITQKRDEVYPHIVPFVVEYLCQTEPKEPRSVAETLRFIAGELGRAPELAGELYAAVGDHDVRYCRSALFEFICAARDPRGAPLLRGGAAVDGWIDAVLALRPAELADEIVDEVKRRPTRDIVTAAGIVAGERARAALMAKSAMAAMDDPRPIGVAFLANSDDRAWFDDLNRTPNETTAKRIYALLAARGPKQRLEALNELAPGITKATERVNAERLFAITLALGDKRPDIVEAAAAALARYVREQKGRVRSCFHPLFLERATAAVERGVTDAAREALEAVHLKIVGAPHLPVGKRAEAPRSRTEVAKAKATEILDHVRQAGTLRLHCREPAIEAQIAVDPEDRDGYLVYADWLQQQGDPYGHWITLHTTKGLAAREAIDAFFVEQRVAILGRELADYLHEFKDAMGLEWHMGFVERVRFPPHAAGPEGLRALLDARCAAFVREIAFAGAERREELLPILLERRPQTLTRLSFGPREDVPEEVLDAMPRLRRDPLAKWNAALARIEDHRRVKAELSASEVPALEALPGFDVAIDMTMVLTGLKHELGLERPVGMVAALREICTPASLDEFACELVRRADLAWARAALGPLGGRTTARAIGRRLATYDRRNFEFTALMGSLNEMGTPFAFDVLAGFAFRGASPEHLRNRARNDLMYVANEREVDVETFVALEAPDADADEALASQRSWLEWMMVDGRTLSVDVFFAMLERPIRLEAARTILWCERDGEVIAGMFRVNERGELVRRDGSRYPARKPIGIVHPAELSESELAAAQRAFGGVTQSILQLMRPVFGISQDEAATDELTRFVKRRVGFHPISNALRRRGWTVAANDMYLDDDEERWLGTRAFSRSFWRDHVKVIAELDDTRGSIASVHFERDSSWYFGELPPTPGTFGGLHVVTLSELLWDLEVAHGRHDDALPDTRVPPSHETPPRDATSVTTTQPIVERAKSGRSKCVVCATAIAKDAMRIGIERHVETPTFRGRATVWIHPACRAGVPELAGVTIAGLD